MKQLRNFRWLSATFLVVCTLFIAPHASAGTPEAMSAVANEQTDAVVQTIRERLNQLLTDTLLQRTQLGLMVYDLTADSVVFAHNHQQTLRPASNEKSLRPLRLSRCWGVNTFTAPGCMLRERWKTECSAVMSV